MEMNKQRWHNNEKSNFCQINIWYCGVFFFPFFCSFWIYQHLTACKNYPHMYHFKLFALFLYCKTSNGAQCTRCEEALWGAALRDAETLSRTLYLRITHSS